ncbi:MAG: hypothetical protein ABI114_07710 [Rhodanobacter sp.]
MQRCKAMKYVTAGDDVRCRGVGTINASNGKSPRYCCARQGGHARDPNVFVVMLARICTISAGGSLTAGR